LLQPEKLAAHQTLAFLGKKICSFVHDFHPDWIELLNLPVSEGLHNQLHQQQLDRILRRLVNPFWDTARLEENKTKVLQVFSRIEISHRDYMGKQIVYCKFLHKPGLEKQDATATTGRTRMDYVFFILPQPFHTGRSRDFDLSLENAWYGRMSLLFSMKFRTDSGEVRDVDCAMIDVFFNYAEGRCFVCTLVHSHIQKNTRVHRIKVFDFSFT
jgi:hypothetical protein